MKPSFLFLTTLFFMVLMQKAMAFAVIKIPVTHFDTTHLERAIELQGSEELDKVVLDCQSFIMGLNVYTKDSQGNFQPMVLIPLDEYECHNALEFVVKGTKKGKSVCMEIDPEKQSMDYRADASTCYSSL